MRKESSVATTVSRIKDALVAADVPGNAQPIVRRKVAVLLESTGRRNVTANFVAELDRELTKAGIFTNRGLLGRPLFPHERLEFSTQRFPPHSVFLATERQVVDFIRRAMGVLPPLDAAGPPP